MSAPSTRFPPIHPLDCAYSEVANQLAVTGLVIDVLHEWHSVTEQWLYMRAIRLPHRPTTNVWSLLQTSHVVTVRVHFVTVLVTVSSRVQQFTLTMWISSLWSRSLIWPETRTRTRTRSVIQHVRALRIGIPPSTRTLKNNEWAGRNDKKILPFQLRNQ